MEEKLKKIQCELIEAVEEQVECLERVDAKELGEVVDIIKDISETLYYHKITEAMEGGEVEKSNNYWVDSRNGMHHGAETERFYSDDTSHASSGLVSSC